MKDALLINKGLADNLGDQLIRFVLTELLKESNFDVDFRDFTEIKQEVNSNYKRNAEIEMQKEKGGTRKIIRYFTKFPLIKNILWLTSHSKIFKKKNFKKKYELIIIGGGQLILSNSTFPFVMYIWCLFLSKNFKIANKAIFGVGSGDNYNKVERFLYTKSLKKMNDVYLRDQHSIDTVKTEFNIDSIYVPDVAFYISKIYKPPFKKEKKAIIGITDYLVYKRYNPTQKSKSEYYSYWKDQVLKYKQEGYKVELFYTTTRDLAESINLQKLLKEQCNIDINIIYVDNLQELINEIAKSMVVVSGRMHALIIGYAYSCKTIPYVLSNKIKSFKEEYTDKQPSIENLQKEIKDKFEKVINKV